MTVIAPARSRRWPHWANRLLSDRERLGLIGRLLRDQGRRQWRNYLLAFGFMAVVAAATAATAWLMRDVIDRVFIAREFKAVWVIAGALVAISVVKGLSAYGQQVILSRIANGIVANLQRRIFSKMLEMSVGYFAARHSTEFIARQSFIVQAASTALNLLITAVARDALTLAALATVMILQEPFMSVLALTVMPLAVLGTRKLSGRVRKVVLTEFEGFGRIMQSLQETAQGIRVVKAYTLEPLMTRRQEAAIASFERAANKLALVGARSSPMMEALGGIAIAAVVLYGGWRVIVGGQAPGAFFSFITALLLAYEPAKRLARLHVDLSGALVGVGMLYEFLDEPGGERDDGKHPDLIVGTGRIEFERVAFEYRPGEPVLRGLDFTAESGQTTALVGPSGGGKSTIMCLLLRYWEPKKGAIRVDGQDISRVSRRSLRRAVSYVGQDNFLFGGTVRDNIAVGKPDASEEEIIDAARAAHAHEFISAFEQGYNTPCGEQGLQLSGGQRQRIAIARAFLKDAPILLLDEATSALDAESERMVQAALERLRAGRTTLVIAHRLATVRCADMIYVIDGGGVRESGRHDELIARHGAYALMAQAQFGPTPALAV